MSKRHQSSRRRTYGRRQHELRERPDVLRVEGRDELDGGIDRPRSTTGLGRFELALAPGLVFLGVD